MNNFKKKLKKNKKKILIIFSSLLLVPTVLLTLIYFSFNGKIFPNIFIGGIYVGDKTPDEAISLLKKDLKIPDYIIVVAGDKEYKIQTSEINLEIDYEKSVSRANNFSNKLSLLTTQKNLGAYLKYDENKLDEILRIISSEIGIPAVYPSVEFLNNEVVLSPGENGIDINISKTKEETLKNLSLGITQKSEIYMKNLDIKLSQEDENYIYNRAINLVDKKITLSFEGTTYQIPKNTLLSFLNYGDTYDLNQIKIYVENLSEKINRPSQNSVFIVEGGNVKEFIPSKNGATVDEEKLVKEIQKSLDEDKDVAIDIPVLITPAKIKNEDVNNLGINTLLGRGVSYFRGSIPNRVYNVNHAALKFKGILVAPGETFSFVNILGDVSALTGYKSAYVIKDGKTVLGDGGGVCQVSTTMFRAALDAGLPILERRAHSYRVGYYEQGFPVGLDATVYYPTTDLKFTNNTPEHILIQSEIDVPNRTLVFEIYGTDDGRVATTTKPVITSSSAPPEDLYVDDPTLPAGKIKQIEYKAWGAKVNFKYTVTRNGETLTEKTFYSNYQPWQAVYLRGVAPTQ